MESSDHDDMGVGDELNIKSEIKQEPWCSEITSVAIKCELGEPDDSDGHLQDEIISPDILKQSVNITGECSGHEMGVKVELKEEPSVLTGNLLNVTKVPVANKMNTPQSISAPENNINNPNNDGEELSPGKDDIIVNRGRKRRRNINIQNDCQIKRNRGMCYINRRGKGRQIEAVKGGPDCKCKFNCFGHIEAQDRETILEEFWKLGNFNLQNAYIFGFLEMNKTKRKTKKTNTPSKRCYSFQYFVRTSDGEKIKVCKMAFLSIHGLQNHRGRVENIAASLKKGVVTPPSDKRGKHQNRSQKILY